MGKDVSERWEKDSYFTGSRYVSMRLIDFGEVDILERCLLESADDPQPFPNRQPVKCSDECCGWHGPAAKSVKWSESDPHQYCPRCWNKVVKHESNGGNP